MSKRRGQLLSEPIVIGTSGTVKDWCRRLGVINLSQLRICCIDEADVMIGVGDVQPICVYILTRLNRSNCQIMLFSATYSDEMMAYAREIVPNPFVSRLRREQQTLANIRQFFIRCYDPQKKYNAIEQMYASLTVGQAIIFCRTKFTALDLVIRMERQKHSVREIMSILDIEQRETRIKQFREGVFRVLISTDIAARGKFISIRLR
jgi:superfamily II DNA/RNA helicase